MKTEQPRSRQCNLSDIRQFSLDIQRYWGSHLYVQVMKGVTPAMDWRTVMLPTDFVYWSKDQLMATMLHEWGHRMISPVSPLIGAIWAKICRKNGLSQRQAKLVVNIATDLWLDYHYLSSDDWSALYRRGCILDIQQLGERMQKAREEGVPEDNLKVQDFLAGCYRRLLEESRNDEKLDLALDTELLHQDTSDEAWTILFEGSGTEESRMKDFAKLMREFLPAEQNINISDLLSEFHDFAPADKGAGEMTIRIRSRARRGGLNKDDMDEVFGFEEMERFRIKTEKLKMYSRIVPVVRNFLNSRPRNQFWGYKTWRVGAPVKNLDILATTQRSPIMLPGINTLSRNYDNRGINPGSGTGAVVIILDDSGSTEGSVLEREKEAAFAVVAAARAFGDPVGMVAYGDTVTAEIPLTTSYQRVEEEVIQLNSDSGGTELNPALVSAYKMLYGIDSFVIMLMTDAQIFDLDLVRQRVNMLPPDSKIISFCFGDRNEIESQLKDLIGPKFKVLVSSPERSFAEAALEEVYG